MRLPLPLFLILVCLSTSGGTSAPLGVGESNETGASKKEIPLVTPGSGVSKNPGKNKIKKLQLKQGNRILMNTSAKKASRKVRKQRKNKNPVVSWGGQPVLPSLGDLYGRMTRSLWGSTNGTNKSSSKAAESSTNGDSRLTITTGDKLVVSSYDQAALSSLGNLYGGVRSLIWGSTNGTNANSSQAKGSGKDVGPVLRNSTEEKAVKKPVTTSKSGGTSDIRSKLMRTGKNLVQRANQVINGGIKAVSGVAGKAVGLLTGRNILVSVLVALIAAGAVSGAGPVVLAHLSKILETFGGLFKFEFAKGETPVTTGPISGDTRAKEEDPLKESEFMKASLAVASLFGKAFKLIFEGIMKNGRPFLFSVARYGKFVALAAVAGLAVSVVVASVAYAAFFALNILSVVGLGAFNLVGGVVLGALNALFLALSVGEQLIITGGFCVAVVAALVASHNLWNIAYPFLASKEAMDLYKVIGESGVKVLRFSTEMVIKIMSLLVKMSGPLLKLFGKILSALLTQLGSALFGLPSFLLKIIHAFIMGMSDKSTL
jgi:hypothetical protein